MPPGYKSNTQEFIEKSTKVHNDLYDYSKTIYTKGLAKVIIICAVHGEFVQKAAEHVKGRGCPLCSKARDGLFSITHGKTKTSEYRVWYTMKERCHKSESAGYYRYGGRGIIVCDRWRQSFENFLADMGERPGKKYSIDRIDNNGNYEPENCRWATQKEQSNNKRTNRIICYNGKSQSIRLWSEELSINYDKLKYRLNTMNIEDAFEKLKNSW